MKRRHIFLLAICLILINTAEAQFIKEMFKGASQSVSLHAILPVNATPSSNLYISGTYGDQIVIGEYKPNGTIVWIKKLMIDDPDYIINSMIKDSDGNLVLCGGKYIGVDDNGFGFLLKFDPVTKNLLWFQKVNENILFFDCAEMGAGGNYIVGGQDESIGTGSAADHLSLIADRNTGNLTVFTNLNSKINENIDALLYDEETKSVYTTGRYELAPGGASKFRICLDKIDSTGVVTWTKFYIKNTTETGRFYPKDIIQDGDNLIIVGSGDDTGTNSFKNFYMLKLDLNGNIIWVNKYDLSGTTNDGILFSIKKHASGYVIYGSLYDGIYTDVFLMSTDFEGSINWTKSYPYRKKTNSFGLQMTSSLAIIGASIYHVGEREMVDGSIRGILMRTPLTSGDVGSCDVDLDITKSVYIEPYQGDYVMSNVSLTQTLTSLAPSVKNQSFNQSITCSENGTREILNDNVALENNRISIFPNPANDYITFEVNFNNSVESIQIFDITGKVVFKANHINTSKLIDISNFPAGIYTIVFQVDNKTITEKIIKN